MSKRRSQLIKEISGGVGGAAAPLTAIVSGGFADGRGVSGFAGNFPYAEERPWTALAPDTVTERNSSKKWLCHFFDARSAGLSRKKP